MDEIILEESSILSKSNLGERSHRRNLSARGDFKAKTRKHREQSRRQKNMNFWESHKTVYTKFDQIEVRAAEATDKKTNQTTKFISHAIYLRNTAAKIKEWKKRVRQMSNWLHWLLLLESAYKWVSSVDTPHTHTHAHAHTNGCTNTLNLISNNSCTP